MSCNCESNKNESKLSRRDEIAMRAMAAMIVKHGVYDELYDHTIEATDKLIEALDGAAK